MENNESILDFINRHNRKVNTDTLTLEEEFLVRQFQHMYNTCKIYLLNKTVENYNSTDTDLMVNIVNINKEVSEYMENLFRNEPEKFKTLYDKAYMELFSE